MTNRPVAEVNVQNRECPRLLSPNDRIRIRSPKTEHHAGKESRMIPIFPELRAPLEEVFDQAEPGSVYVITRYRQSNVNLRTQLIRIIERAGLNAWPKLFQNLRSTRETELCEQYPIHVVTQWLGNSVAVAAKHYLQVTDEHFEKAAGKSAQNPTQSAHDTGDLSCQESDVLAKTSEFSSVGNRRQPYAQAGVGDEGLEPNSVTRDRATSSDDDQLAAREKGAESGAVRNDLSNCDPELLFLIEAWPTLSADVRAEVVRIVLAAE